MAKDEQIENIVEYLDDLLDAVEEYKGHLKGERETAQREQPSNDVYIRRISGMENVLDSVVEQLDGDVRDALVQLADSSFSKNRSKDPNFR